VSEWKIDPGTVGAVLTSAYDQAGSAEGLAGAVTEAQVTAVMDGVSWGSIYTRVVPGAVGALLTGVAEDVGKIANRVVAGVMGVTAATLAYQEGQQDMSEQERAMMAGAEGDFSWFQAHGYMEA
jgi:hypothetical protein